MRSRQEAANVADCTTLRVRVRLPPETAGSVSRSGLSAGGRPVSRLSPLQTRDIRESVGRSSNVTHSNLRRTESVPALVCDRRPLCRVSRETSTTRFPYRVVDTPADGNLCTVVRRPRPAVRPARHACGAAPGTSYCDPGPGGAPTSRGRRRCVDLLSRRAECPACSRWLWTGSPSS